MLDNMFLIQSQFSLVSSACFFEIISPIGKFSILSTDSWWHFDERYIFSDIIRIKDVGFV